MHLSPAHLPSFLKESLVGLQRGCECIASCDLCRLFFQEGEVVLFSFEYVKSQSEHKFCVLF